MLSSVCDTSLAFSKTNQWFIIADKRKDIDTNGLVALCDEMAVSTFLGISEN
jgi:hypothetical protein